MTLLMKKHFLTHIHTQFRPNCMLQTTRTTRPPLHHLSLRPPTPPMCPCSIAVASRYHLGCSAIANLRREIFTCVSCCIECHLDGRQMVSHQSHARWSQALEHTCWLECAAMVKHTLVVVLPASHFTYDWLNYQPEGSRNWHFHCQAYWRLYGLVSSDKYSAECSYCVSKITLWHHSTCAVCGRMVTDNANHKHGRSS